MNKKGKLLCCIYLVGQTSDKFSEETEVVENTLPGRRRTGTAQS